MSKQAVFKWLPEDSVQSYYAIAITTLSDWLKNLNAWEAKENQWYLVGAIFAGFEKVTSNC